eukprot:Skav214198  [mRNA]  locus=scaffold2153:122724:133563:+ [translate_table: standard]
MAGSLGLDIGEGSRQQLRQVQQILESECEAVEQIRPRQSTNLRSQTRALGTVQRWEGPAWQWEKGQGAAAQQSRNLRWRVGSSS